MAKVKSIRYIGKQDTYNMDVDNYQNFSVNGGLIVHNSGYLLVAYHVHRSGRIEPPKKELPFELRTPEPERDAVQEYLWS